ncbi:MAG: ABC transporter substrate-binding protein [Candidatus Magnetomorum sp.]|nr:ABC transporter substrate-binding protein [Candidatus Magnetomorum sp.]
MKKFLLPVTMSFIFCITVLSPAFAGDALSDLKQNIDQVLGLLKETQKEGTPESKIDVQKKIFQMAIDLFDFPEMSQRTLGKNWKILKPEQQKVFSDLFARFLANIYYNRLEQYTNQVVKYVDQRDHGSDKALVKTVIVTQNNEIPMDYSMLKNNRWQVYDVSIEGVSLVRNYRSQFQKILSNQSIDDLIDMMKKKLGQFSNI